MGELIGVAGMAVLAAIYVGLGLADRGGGCGGCAVAREDDPACDGCELAGPRRSDRAAGATGGPGRTSGHESEWSGR
jgi:hypothetical protein